MLSIGSATVGLTPTKLSLSAPGPGSLVLTNTGATAITLGGAGVVAGGVGSGQATLPAGGILSLPLAGGINPGTLYGITVTAPVTLNWFYSTEITP